MASKLFRAVVGFGISFGTASAACLGATDGGTVTTNPAVPERDGATPDPVNASDSGKPSVDGSARDDASGDAAVDALVDASADAPTEVDADAFCDAPWPTTKAGVHTPPECVDPTGACADAGMPTSCWKKSDAGACDTSITPRFSVCIGGVWKCQGDLSECL